MRYDRYEYHSWKGMPNVPYRKEYQRTALDKIMPAFLVGCLLAFAVLLAL